jgi:hypothetical protein
MTAPLCRVVKTSVTDLRAALLEQSANWRTEFRISWARPFISVNDQPDGLCPRLRNRALSASGVAILLTSDLFFSAGLEKPGSFRDVLSRSQGRRRSSRSIADAESAEFASEDKEPRHGIRRGTRFGLIRLRNPLWDIASR